MASGKKATVKKTSAKKIPAKTVAVKKAGTEPPSRRPVSLPASGKDPKGGLSAEGRKIYNDATGGHLKKGVQGEADTPEKMLRKGSFLRRHFATPPGPVVDAKGEPTRQALQAAAAWGEPVPKSEADEKKLAEKDRNCWNSTTRQRAMLRRDARRRARVERKEHPKRAEVLAC